MTITDFYIATTISVILSLITEEFFGVSPGGVIVPGVLALHFYYYPSALAILFISFIVYLLIEYVFSKFIILYGKRRYSLSILLALLIKIVIDYSTSIMPFALVAYRGIGAITPALLANTYSKQGIFITLLSTFVVSVIIFVLLNLIYIV